MAVEPENKLPKPPSESSGERTVRAQVWRQFAEYSSLAMAMPIATVVGWAAGRWLDRVTGASFFWIIGLALGIAAGFIQLIRTALRDSKRPLK